MSSKTEVLKNLPLSLGPFRALGFGAQGDAGERASGFGMLRHRILLRRALDSKSVNPQQDTPNFSQKRLTGQWLTVYRDFNLKSRYTPSEISLSIYPGGGTAYAAPSGTQVFGFMLCADALLKWAEDWSTLQT